MQDHDPRARIKDNEANRFSARAARFAKVGANMGGVAARIAGSRLMGSGGGDAANAVALAKALGGLKGPMMKVAQMLATIPEAVPPEYAEELRKLQADAPPMGAAFVRRRMQAELGPNWRARFKSFDLHPAAAASLGQVHRAVAEDGEALACKLQYPDMKSAVEADFSQLEMLFALHRRLDPVLDTREMAEEIGERVREELDYAREAKHTALYRGILAPFDDIRVPGVKLDLSTDRLLTMQWLDGGRLLDFTKAGEAERARIAAAMFKAWWIPFIQYGIIHGDPHLGNYTIFGTSNDPGDAAGINLLDYGCVRIFPPKFVGGVVDLYQGLLANDFARTFHAYESWGFRGLTKDLAEILNIWARFIYGPLLDDRVRTVADGVSPGQYGRKEVFQVHQALKQKGPVRVPREFVFMDRAAIGLGGAFLHLGARLNFHRMYNEAIGTFSADALRERQTAALSAVGLSSPR